MDDTRSKPTFFERLISRLAGEPDSAEDVLSLLRQAHEQEVFDADTLLRLEKVLDFADLEVRDAMITRSHMNVLKENDSIERITAYVIETAHSRFPVIGEDKDEVLGILHAKDLLKYMFNPEQFNLKSILRPAVFVPEGKSLNALLKEFREQRNHMAIVIDEYGGTSGLVTFEDIIEQIVGDIEDEFDEDESADNIHAVSTERWRINAVTEIEDIATSKNGVKSAYAINAGREIRVIANAKLINDDEAVLLSKEIADEIQTKVQYPGEIKVSVIRETRAVEYAK